MLEPLVRFVEPPFFAMIRMLRTLDRPMLGAWIFRVRGIIRPTPPHPLGNKSAFRKGRIGQILISALLASSLFSSAERCLAHPISITYTIAFVSQDQVTVNIEGFLEDLYMYHALKLDNDDHLPRDQID